MSGEKVGVEDFIDDLTKLARSISLESLPLSVVHEGRRTLVDALAVILGGMGEPQVRALARQMAVASVGPCSSILGTGQLADAMWAALANGTAGVWHEFDAGNRFVGGHPAIYAVTVGLAVAEREDTSGKRLLEGIIAGYEVGARVGLGTTLRPGMDPHGSWPIVGAAATAGLLMDYNHTDLRETINVSTSLNLATSCKAAYEGANIRNVYAGFGAAMGVFASDLVNDGFTGERDGISTVFGGIAGVYFDVDKALDAIGQRWEIERGYHKLHACARCVHPALDALIAITGEEEILPEEVERIEVRTYAMAATMNNAAPESALEAKFSIPHALASYLVLKETGIDAYSDSAVHDQKIRALAAKVTVRNDHEMNARTPVKRPAAVRVELRDGRVQERLVRLPQGEFDTKPRSDDDLSDKFKRLSSNVLDSDTAATLLDRLWHIETEPEVRELTTMGRGG